MNQRAGFTHSSPAYLHLLATTNLCKPVAATNGSLRDGGPYCVAYVRASAYMRICVFACVSAHGRVWARTVEMGSPASRRSEMPMYLPSRPVPVWIIIACGVHVRCGSWPHIKSAGSCTTFEFRHGWRGNPVPEDEGPHREVVRL